MGNPQERPSRSINDTIDGAASDAEFWGNHGEKVFIPGLGNVVVASGKPPLKNPVKAPTKPQASPDTGEDEERFFY